MLSLVIALLCCAVPEGGQNDGLIFSHRFAITLPTKMGVTDNLENVCVSYPPSYEEDGMTISDKATVIDASWRWHRLGNSKKHGFSRKVAIPPAFVFKNGSKNDISKAVCHRLDSLGIPSGSFV